LSTLRFGKDGSVPTRNAEEIGPVEILAVGFPGSRFNGDVLPSLADLVDRELIRVLDLVVVKKEEDGGISALEIDLLDDDDAAEINTLHVEGVDMLGEDDLSLAADEIPNGTTAVVLVWEDVWATRFAKAMRDSGGVLLAYDRIPHEVVAEILAFEGGEA
jgi:Family of unknown function (DUF6325)